MPRLARMSLMLLVLAVYGCATFGGRAAVDRGVPNARTQVGFASYYAHFHDGKRTASGRTYHEEKLTAAHLTLPFGTRVRVTNLRNGRDVVVTITDRGPYARGRIIDVSRRAASELGFLRQGIARVRVEVIKRA